jgi:hypothetical protein
MAMERTGRWTADEDSKLKDALQKHGDNNWGSIAELVLVEGVQSNGGEGTVWIPASTRRLDVRIDEEKGMQYKPTTVRSGMRLPRSSCSSGKAVQG